MPGLDEFSLIERLFAPLAARHPGALGLTDDAALIDGPAGQQWAITTDALVAGVHFLPDDPPDLIARKLLRVNLSDLAAMGATPFAVLLATCFPLGVDERWLECFASGLKTDCEIFSVAVIGGDTVATPGPLTLAVTAIGAVAQGSALLRSNARSGDDIWVSGAIGDAAFGLLVAQGRTSGLTPAAVEALLERYRLPSPRTALGPALIGLARAAMDISDGLIGDLDHICKTSGVGAVVEAGRLPLSAAVEAAMAAGFGGVERALTGGDDYELLFTVPPDKAAAIGELGRRLGLRLTKIGQIIDGEGVRVVNANGDPLTLTGSGYRHFGG
ncbi:thiamine-phosphate kinase [Telmatospirillum sp.]|uniref:thiamine-phosphate kinase n=1 Tax=Telmatospirillum sp. TaxID=2079197 RepID=UPI0028457CD6|nr:thiamine-phosphate kinase [Telmatospirillum sp.]MDR3440833.1 thiamine-phosphate kinase [Telmatospirillum sp.]